jgi:hypothetical protein
MTLAQALAVAAAALVTAAGPDGASCLLATAQARVSAIMHDVGVCGDAARAPSQGLRLAPDWLVAHSDRALPDATIHANARL